MDSLFTNVPLDETIKICIDELFKSEMIHGSLPNDIKYYLEKLDISYNVGTLYESVLPGADDISNKSTIH